MSDSVADSTTCDMLRTLCEAQGEELKRLTRELDQRTSERDVNLQAAMQYGRERDALEED